MCTIPIIFRGFEKYVENNIFDFDFNFMTTYLIQIIQTVKYRTKLDLTKEQ